MNAQLTKTKDMTMLSLMLEYDKLQRQIKPSESDIARKNELQTEIAQRVKTK